MHKHSRCRAAVICLDYPGGDGSGDRGCSGNSMMIVILLGSMISSMTTMITMAVLRPLHWPRRHTLPAWLLGSYSSYAGPSAEPAHHCLSGSP